MSKNVVETVLGAIVLLVAVGFLFFAYRTTDLAPTKGYEIVARFSTASGINTGTEVQIAGVKVGKVLGTTLDLKQYQALIRLNINEGIELPLDTTATVKSEGLLGGKYLALEIGSDEEFIEPGGMIEYTQAGTNLEDLLGKAIFSLDNKASDSK